MNVGSLFSGIGGLDLGLERAGMKVKWQVECDEFAQHILEKQWPRVKRYRRVEEVSGNTLAKVDVLAGGFPCQDISIAGRGAGITGPRSGLWGQFVRLIGELRPSWVVIENTGNLVNRGLPTVLRDLTRCGYDAEWQSLPAVAFGAPHFRNRTFIVAYPTGSRLEGIFTTAGLKSLQSASRNLRRVWDSEPEMDRVAYGLPRGMGTTRTVQLMALGNAVVPQVAEYIGRLIRSAP